MKHPRFTNTILAACLIVAGAVAAFGQQVEPSYDLTLQLVIGSNEAGMKTDMPATLATVSQQIKSRFGFASYRLANTFQSRVGDGGDTEYKSMMNIFGKTSDPNHPSFLELTVAGFRNVAQQKGIGAFHARAFRFGARVPVSIGGSTKDETGKSRPVMNYEQIGLTLTKLNVTENVPTLIGTLNLPGANGTIFLVMTVKSVDM